MRLEDLKQQYPEPPEFIHQMILSEVEKQMNANEGANETRSIKDTGADRTRSIKDTGADRTGSIENMGADGMAGIKNTGIGRTANIKKRSRPWTVRRIAAVSLAACLALGTVGFAAAGIYRLQMEKNGKYGAQIRVETDAGADADLPLPEKMADVKIEAEYIPEGMSWQDEYRLKYEGEDRKDEWFTFATLLLDTDNAAEEIEEAYVAESEKTSFGEHEGIYIRREQGDGRDLSQMIYLLCPEKQRMVAIYIGSEVPKEEAYKVASGIRLSDTQTMLDTSEMWKWSEFVSAQKGADETEQALPDTRTSVSKEEIELYEIGNPVRILDASGEDAEGNYISTSDVTAAVDSVEVADDLSLLGRDAVPDIWKKETGPDGKLLKNTLSYMKAGDGVNTLYKEVRTEDVAQKLVLATVTYTNTGDEEIANVLYGGTMILFDETGDGYRLHSYERGPAGDAGGEYDYISQTGAGGGWTMEYYSPHTDQGNGGNYISALKPGESVQVKMGWIVNGPDLEKMYLSLSGRADPYYFYEEELEAGFVDIRQ